MKAVSKEKPRRQSPIIGSLLVALILSMAPLPEWADPYRPDWVVLTLVYWAITFPFQYNVGSAWIAGLVLDVAQGTLLGQHALALSLIVYICVKFHLQIRQFPTLQLTATVFAMLALFRFVLFWINGVAGISAPSVVYWGPVLSGTLIWPVLMQAMSPVRQRARR